VYRVPPITGQHQPTIDLIHEARYGAPDATQEQNRSVPWTHLAGTSSQYSALGHDSQPVAPKIIRLNKQPMQMYKTKTKRMRLKKIDRNDLLCFSSGRTEIIS
jgi:hypothetical protein